ncbi:hypothetical protein G4Y79_08050 [Phototrophicus methaneseepsis]|uniref:Tetratricopeptide repeat protein n=1 Tax=Phototrophicus methaneseepsis TaxID=2710758 RepID=A0A7S8IGP8_9CHLR|nr:hypothetical protein [Phototrophicus methaneseepsis]QPC84313.1 hypothetical protein G4Y79_08050 [Phototrophicus methaneseepsis]
MIYGRKTQNSYPGRGVVLAIQAILILGIAYFGIEALANIFDKMAPSPYNANSVVVYPSNASSSTAWDVDRSTMNAEYASYYSHLGHQYLYITGEPAQALVQFNKAQSFAPNDPNADLAIGVAYEHMDMPSRAAAEFLDYLRMNEDYYVPQAWYDEVRQTVQMYEGRIFAYDVDATAGDTLSVRAQSVEYNEVDPLIVILDPYGNPLTGRDDVLDGRQVLSMDAFINEYSLPISGDYTVLVSHAGGGSIGMVDVTVDLD